MIRVQTEQKFKTDKFHKYLFNSESALSMKLFNHFKLDSRTSKNLLVSFSTLSLEIFIVIKSANAGFSGLTEAHNLAACNRIASGAPILRVNSFIEAKIVLFFVDDQRLANDRLVIVHGGLEGAWAVVVRAETAIVRGHWNQVARVTYPPVHPPVKLVWVGKVRACCFTVFSVPGVLVHSEGMKVVLCREVVDEAPNVDRGRAICRGTEVNQAQKTVRVGGCVRGIVLHLAGGLPKEEFFILQVSFCIFSLNLRIVL